MFTCDKDFHEYLLDLERNIFIKELELLILKDERFSRFKINKLDDKLFTILKDRYDNFGVDDEFKNILFESLPTHQKQIVERNSKDYKKSVRKLNKKIFF